MKKIFQFFIVLPLFYIAQTNSNRFFYQFVFNNSDSAQSKVKDSVMTSLDVYDSKTLYRDYTLVAQDSIIRQEFETMKKTGVFQDLTSLLRMNKFSYKIYRDVNANVYEHIENIMGTGFTYTNIGYKESIDFNWKIVNEHKMLENYKVQKAVTTFGGREWVAWFTMELPFSAGPYKFHGLPGLIVQVSDTNNNFSWFLKGNQKIAKFEEFSVAEKITQKASPKINYLSKEKFHKVFFNYMKDPLGGVRNMLTPELLGTKMQGSSITIGDMIKSQEKIHKEMYKDNYNNIEIINL